MSIFTGSGVALVTPFNNKEIDFNSFEKLIEWQINEGSDAIIACGTTGEASTLTDDEQIEVVKFAVKITNGRIPVIAGGGSNDTHHGIHLNKELEQVGADALLHVTPYYNKCSQRGLMEHFIAIADAVEIPMIIYSVQSRTGVNIEPKTVFELSKHPKIIGIKEASGNIAQVAEIARLVDEDFYIYSGNDDMIVPLLALGGKGAISTVANIIPNEVHLLVKYFLDGNLKESCKLQLDLKPLMDSMFVDVNPIPVKAALYMMGKIALDYRLPLCPPSEEAFKLIQNQMKTFGLI
jgi:4-hydroxy-tetrahydrodipicolinate synthase